MRFFINNWKAFTYPLFCLSILIVDQLVLNVPLLLTLLKIGGLSFLHVVFVFKNKYVFDSDIYHYISNLRTELDKHNMIKPILTSSQSMYLFWFYFLILTLFLSDFVHTIEYKMLLFYSVVILTIIVFVDGINEIFRAFTNKADLNKVYTPFSLRQTRYMWKALAQLTPVCASIGKIVTGTLVGTEIIGPGFIGNGQTIGPVTKVIANDYIYPGCNITLQTKYDIAYESYKSGWNLEVNEGLRPESTRIPERVCSIKCKKDMLDLGLTDDMIGALSTSSAISISNKK